MQIKPKLNYFTFDIEEDPDRKEVTNASLGNKTDFHRMHRLILKEGWDIFKLLNFLSYFPDDFSSDKVQRTTKEGFHKMIKIKKGNVVYFEIYVTNGLEKQAVFLKRWINWIEREGFHYYIKKLKWTLEKNEQHPLLIFAKYFANIKRAPCHIFHAVFKGLFKRPGRYDKDQREETTSGKLECISEALPGYVEIVLQDHVEGGFVVEDGKVLQRFTWVCSWAANRVKQTHYLELDASFKATKPYCYCCINSIRNNESVPIALSIEMKENFHLYENAYRCVESSGIDVKLLNSIPILSDMGKGIIKFAKERNLIHFFCHRHILEVFGIPILRNWVLRLLECVKEEQYLKLCPQISEEISIWCSQLKPELIPEKINLIYEMLDPNSTHPQYNIKKWALWERFEFHVGRCTNHCESFHRVINSHCFPKRDFLDRIITITKMIIKKYTKQGEVHGRTIRDRFWKYSQFKSTAIVKGWDLSEYSKEHCECGWNDYYSSILGVRFPCIHEIFNQKFESYPSPPELVVEPYQQRNEVKLIFSQEVRVLPRMPNNENENKGILLEGDDDETSHKISSLAYSGPNTRYAKEEFWKVVRELRQIYLIDKHDAIDIAMDEFAQWGLNKEETASVINIAHFRISCWNIGNKFKEKRDNNKKNRIK